jgi:hypothetical protein
MCKEIFSTHDKSKLQPWRDGSFQIIEMINNNAYKATLNVFFILTLFDICDDLRSNPFKKRKDDEDQPNTNVNYPLEVPIESITWSKGKEAKWTCLTCLGQDKHKKAKGV